MLGRHLTLCEDSHTASVFTHLLHLPLESFWTILRRACYTERLPRDPGELLDVAPWPRWDAAGIPGKTTVVPDLFLRFAAFDLIIEAKRGDEGMQDPNQWQRELIAYTNEHGDDGKPVKMIALGGIHGKQDAEVTYQTADPEEPARKKQWACPVYMCQWRGILDQCRRMRHELDRLDYPTSQSSAASRVLADLIDLFAWHGYSTGAWFADVETARYRLAPSVHAHLRLFADRSHQLTSP